MFNLVNDIKAIGKLNTKAHKAGENAAVALHEAGFNCVAHVVNTGDIRPLQHLHDGLKPRAKQALAQWAAKHCPKVKYDHKAGSFGVKKTTDGTDMAVLQELGPMDYIKVPAAKVAKVFDLKKELAALVAKADRAKCDNTKAIGYINQALKAA